MVRDLGRRTQERHPAGEVVDAVTAALAAGNAA
jgi:hypothetical protein